MSKLINKNLKIKRKIYKRTLFFIKILILFLSSKIKKTEQQEYINIPLPIGLAKEIDDIIKEGEYGYKTKSEFVKEAVREKLRELINLRSLKIEYKKTKKS